MSLEHRVFLYDTCPQYWSYKKCRRCRRRSFDAPLADKITVYICMNRCVAAGSNVERKTTRSRHVLTYEKLKIVDSSFRANGRVCTISTNCNKMLHLYTKKKKRAVMVPAIHDAVWSKTMLWTGIVLWSLMRVQTSHSFCVASWMLDLLTVQVPIWNTTYLFVLVWLCEMLFVFKNDYWAHFLFVWDKVTPPHVAHIVTPFLHTSPITGETRFFCRQVSATPHGRFWMYSLFKPDEFST